MNKQKIALQISLLTVGLFFVLSAQVGAERIKQFDSQIVISPDSSIRVVETIVYDSEGVEKHGIFRDITPRSSTGDKIEIKDISVFDSTGTLLEWQRQNNNGDIRLKIGDPDTTFEGVKTYIIEYTATNALAYLESMDEIYWNVTGNAWPFIIEKVSAVVVLPVGASSTQSYCYVGVVGSTQACSYEDTVFQWDTALSAGEGMTIAVGFPKGLVYEHIPTQKEKIVTLIGKFWPVIIPLLVFIFMFRAWYRKGRDAKGAGIIMTQYEVADDLTPLEASVVLNQKFGGKDLIAEILFLATKGYITILQTQEKQFLGKKIDYTLTLKKVPTSELTSFDKQLLQEIFNLGNDSPLLEGKSITLSQSYSLFSITTSLSTKIKERLVDGGYYTKDFLPKSFSINSKRFLSTVVVVVLVGFFVIRYLSNQTEDIVSVFFGHPVTVILIIGGVILSGIIAVFFTSIMPAKTKKGVLIKEHLLGLKEYIKVAEKDRITFHNAPEVNATLFEKLLPYAVMFGLEKKWVGAFEGIALPSPSWYSSGGSSFVPALFVSDFSNNFSSSFFTTASTGGSGGGGSSGGGGGGGGGGSW